MDNGMKHTTLDGHSDDVSTVIFTSDNQHLISASWDKTLIIWSVRTGNQLRTFRGHTEDVLGCSLTSDDTRLLSSCSGGNIKIWSVDTGVCEVTIFCAPYFHKIKFCNRDLHIIIAGNRKIQLWTVAGKLVRTVMINTAFDALLLVMSENRFLFTEWIHHTVQVWDFATDTCVQIFRGHTHPVFSGFFVRENTAVVSRDSSDTLCIWGVDNGVCTHQFKNNVVRTNEGMTYWLEKKKTEGIIVYTKNEVHILAISSGEKIRTFSMQRARLQVSFDGRFFIWDIDGTIRFSVFTHKNITHN